MDDANSMTSRQRLVEKKYMYAHWKALLRQLYYTARCICYQSSICPKILTTLYSVLTKCLRLSPLLYLDVGIALESNIA